VFLGQIALDSFFDGAARVIAIKFRLTSEPLAQPFESILLRLRLTNPAGNGATLEI